MIPLACWLVAMGGGSGRVMAQQLGIAPYDHVPLTAIAPAEGGDIKGLAHWHTGALVAIIEPDAASDEAWIRFYSPSNQILKEVQIDGFPVITGAPLAEVTAYDVVSAHPSLEALLVPSATSMPVTAFAVGTWYNGLGSGDGESSEDGFLRGIISCQNVNEAHHSWLVKCDSVGNAPNNNVANIRTFCASQGGSVWARGVAPIENGAHQVWNNCLLVAGSWQGQVNFGKKRVQTGTGNGSFVMEQSVGIEDGFVVVLDAEQGHTSFFPGGFPIIARENTPAATYFLRIAGPGATVKINDVAAPAIDRLAIEASGADPLQPYFAVTGSFKGTVNFDPTGALTGLRTSSEGNSDLFVACYRIENLGFTANRFELAWVFVRSTPYDDAGLCVAMDDSLDVFVGGCLGDPFTLVNGSKSGDAYIAGFVDEIDGPTQSWEHVLNDNDGPVLGCDARVNAVALDSVGRPVFVGTFGDQNQPGPGQFWIDLDPSAASAQVSHLGRTDMFVARYNHLQLGSFDWGFGSGTSGFDSGLGVAVDRFNSARLSYGGRRDSDIWAQPNFYRISAGLDIVTTLVLRGGALLGSVMATEVANSVNIPDETTGPGPQPVNAISTIVTDVSGFPEYYGISGGPVQMIPFLPITSKTRAIAVRRLETMRTAHAGAAHRVSEAFTFAASLADIGHLDPVVDVDRLGQVYLVTQGSAANTAGEPAMEAARQTVLGTHLYSRTHGVHLHNPSQQAGERLYIAKHVAGSEEKFPTDWSKNLLVGQPWENTLGLAGQTIVPLNGTMQGLILARISHWPGDYNRDGTVDVQFTYQCDGTFTWPIPGLSGVDWHLMDIDTTNQVPYADWNLNGAWGGNNGPNELLDREDFGIDFSKFICDALFGCVP